MAEQIAIGVAEEAVQSLISRTWLEIRYMFNYNNNIKKLEDKVKDLEVKEDDVKLQVHEAERNGEIIRPIVSEWMKKVDYIKKEANELLERTRNAQMVCLCCKCPKLHVRYNTSKQASTKTSEVIELQNASKFERIGYVPSVGQMPLTSPQYFDGFESRISIRNDVMEALKDDSITKIGICGMAGVGKTTLVHEIADKVKAKNLFDDVAVASVSKDLVLANIRDELAENLGLKIEEKTDHQRAERLYTRLMNKGKRTLIILDDIWQELDLHAIGIPVEDDRQGVKLLLTSRYKSVCNNMRAKIFELKVLSEEESWHLFKDTAEISGEANDDANDIAVKVMKQCGGLPLAIGVIGKALKKKGDYVWRDVLQQLEDASVTTIPEMHDSVNSRIEISIKYLADNSESLLLLCSLFPEDHNILLEDLVRYAKGLQLFKKSKTMARLRDRVYSLTDGLKSCYLLLDGKEGCVKLHDVVRDVCLSIVSSDEHMYMVRHDGLNEWPQEDSYASCTAISLTFDEINQIPSGLECPKLKLMRLIFQKRLEKERVLHIPEDFLNGMKELEVLELIKLKGKLPMSLQSLVKLRALCIDNCTLNGHISVIRGLKELEILRFYGSRLEHFPDEIAELSNLKSLDLRFKKGPPLPSGVLLRLKKLEELYLGNYFWGSKRVEACSVITTEISSLLNLQTFEFNAYDGYFLEQVLEKLHHEKLKRFLIRAGNWEIPYEKDVEQFQFSKVLTLMSVNVDLLKKRSFQALLWKSQDLSLVFMNGLTNLVNELDGEGFNNLRKLDLLSCDVKYLVDGTSFTRDGAFINLEELKIISEKNMEELCHKQLPRGSFAKLRKLYLQYLPLLSHLWGTIQPPCLGNLTTLDLNKCGLIRSLFLKSSLKCLGQLRRIKIWHCEMLERVVSNDEEDEKDTRDIELPKLDFLELSDLESFSSFGPGTGLGALFKAVMLVNLETLRCSVMNGIRWIMDDQMLPGSLSRLQTISLYRCHGLVHVATSGSIQMLQSLEEIRIFYAESLEVVLDFTGLNVGTDMETLLGRLESLCLRCLPKLKHIWKMVPDKFNGFKNLRSLSVKRCDTLRYLISPSMAKMFPRLEILKVKSCPQMETIFARDEGSVISDNVNKKDGEENTNIIEFPKLECLEVDELNIQMFCSEKIDFELPSLTELHITNCPRLTKFCAGRLSAKMLNIVRFGFYDAEEEIQLDGAGEEIQLDGAGKEIMLDGAGEEIQQDGAGEEIQLDGVGEEIQLDVFHSWLKDSESGIRCWNCSFLKIEECDHLH